MSKLLLFIEFIKAIPALIRAYNSLKDSFEKKRREEELKDLQEAKTEDETKEAARKYLGNP